MSVSDFDDLFADLPDPVDVTASQSSNAEGAPVPADPNVVFADEMADPDDFIFDGINVTQTAALTWASELEEMPELALFARDLTPGSSTPTESSVSTPKDDPAAPAGETKSAESPCSESIDPRALDINAVLPLDDPRPRAPEPRPATPQLGADVPLPAGSASQDVPDLDDLEAFFNSLPTQPVPHAPQELAPGADQFSEMLAMMFALQQQGMPPAQPAYPTPQMPMQMPQMPQMPMHMPRNMSMGPGMPFVPPQFYPPGYNMPQYMPTPQEMYWMQQQQQQQRAQTGPARTMPRQARPRPSPYAVNPHAPPGPHDAWRNPHYARPPPVANARPPNTQTARAPHAGSPNPQNVVLMSPNLEGLGPRPTADELLAAAGKPAPKARKSRVPKHIAPISQWPAGMPLPGIAPPSHAVPVPLPPLPPSAETTQA